MSSVPYKVSDEKWYWRPEPAYADANNNGIVDETNAATGTFYPLPVFIGSDNPVHIRKKVRYSKHRSGSTYHNQINKEGYEEVNTKFVGPIFHRSWLHYVTDGVVTDGTYNADTVASGQGTAAITMTASTTIAVNVLAGLTGVFTGSSDTSTFTIASNTASSGSAVVITLTGNSPADANGKVFTLSTHYHIYTNTTTHVNPPKTFELLHVFPNDKSGGGESIIELITGNEVVSYIEKGDENNLTCIGDWTVKGRNIITGTPLTSPGYPVYPNLDFVSFAQAVLKWTKGGVALDGVIKSYEIAFITDKALIKTAAYYPIAAKAPNMRDVYLKIGWMPYETDSYDDSQDDPHTAQNKDVVLKNSRNVLTDFFQIAFVDGFQEMEGDPTWVGGNLYETHIFWINPHEATPSSMTLTECNTLDDDQYET